MKMLSQYLGIVYNLNLESSDSILMCCSVPSIYPSKILIHLLPSLSLYFWTQCILLLLLFFKIRFKFIQYIISPSQITALLLKGGCLVLPCLFKLYAEHIMRNARMDELQAGIKIRAGETSVTSDMHMIPL